MSQNDVTIDTLTVIVEYGLSVRRIPPTVTHTREMHYHREGNTIVEVDVTDRFGFEAARRLARDGSNWRFDEDHKRAYRRYTQWVTVPEHAGYWMCQQVSDTSSTVMWNTRKHHLAPTLSESVKLFLDSVRE